MLDLMRLKDSNTTKKLRNLLDEFISPPHEKFIINSLKTLVALGAITDINDNGTITKMGEAICKFRAISPCLARSIIASHFYGVSRSLCDIVALSHSAGGRIGNIFNQYYPDKRKNAEWNRKELNKHKNAMRMFEHPYGDYMTMLKAYKIYLRFIGDKKKDAEDANLEHNIVTDNFVDVDINEEADINNENENIDNIQNIQNLDDLDDNNKIKPGVSKWCKEHYLNARKLATVRELSRQLYRTLQDLLKPYTYVKPVGRALTKKEKENISIMEINSVLDEINDVPNTPDTPDTATTPTTDEYNINDDAIIESMKGGFIRRIEKEEEIERLETNVKRF